jgi:quercetin dioxygenase-like cupin family protein
MSDDVTIKRFEDPDELRMFGHGSFALATLGGVTVGRASYDPGWIWSEHVGAATGEDFCEVEHVGLVISGSAAVKMRDGTRYELTPGDLFFVAPGHDSWVIGDEPYVSLHLQGATEYAAHDRST